MHGEAGKGDGLRPRQTGDEEHQLRGLLMDGEISRRTFDRRYAKLLRAGKITRGGRVLRP